MFSKFGCSTSIFHMFHFEKSIKMDKNFNAPNPSLLNDKYYLNDLPN